MSARHGLFKLSCPVLAWLATIPISAGQPLQAPVHPRLDRSILRVLDSGEPLITAERLGYRLRDGRVQVVVVVTETSDTSEIVRWLRARDARHISTVRNMIQTHVDVETLIGLGANPVVRWVRRPMYAEIPIPPASSAAGSKAGQATTQGLAAMNGPAWHAAGFTGQGIKVGVIDMGWLGYQALVGNDLPPWSRLNVRAFGAFDIDSSNAHGTRVTEVIYDIVPDAEFYLAMCESGIDVLSALDWMRDEGVDVVAEMALFAFCGPGDGTGLFLFSEFAELTIEHGMLLVTGAGNYREQHWQGTSTDSDGDGWVEFAGNDEYMTYVDSDGGDTWFDSGKTITAYLVWNDWTAMNQDYALHLYRASGSSWSQVTVSDYTQDGGEDHWPMEAVNYRTESSGNYAIRVRRSRVDGVHDMELFTPRTARLEHMVPEGSIMTPADSPHVVAAGASKHMSPFPYFYFSSRGPTNGPGGTLAGGTIKPDVSGYAEVDTVSHGPSKFSGTSAACPHVAGAAALAWSARPDWSNLEVRRFLSSTAIDMGHTGMDNDYGAGRLHLGDPLLHAVECAADVESPNPDFSADGGAGTVAVSIAAGCQWFAATHADWIGITGPDAGDGSGTVSYAVEENPTCAGRSATLMVAGATVTVTQNGHPPAACPRRASGRLAP